MSRDMQKQVENGRRQERDLIIVNITTGELDKKTKKQRGLRVAWKMKKRT